MKTKLKKHIIHRGVSRKPLEYYDTKEADRAVKLLEVDADIWHSQSQSIKLNADFWREHSISLENELEETRLILNMERVKYEGINRFLNTELRKTTTTLKITVYTFALAVVACAAYLHSLGVF
ncbi:MAG: hypothetical protein PHS93_09835 [Candidatus Omnitrophica bacterium]|nr:hypothetical protein [Candidatus Omnitrophota bacterium]